MVTGEGWVRQGVKMFAKYRLTFDRILLWSLVKERGFAWFLVVYTPLVFFIASELSVLLPDRIRYAGVAYNFTAIIVAAVMVMLGVYRYKVPPVFLGWGSYFSCFFPVFFRPRVISAEAHMAVGTAVGVGTAVARASLSGTNEEKIEQLDQRTHNMESRIDTLHGTFHKQTQEFEERFKKERAQRSEESEAVRQLVRQSLFGDHGWELVVAFYLILGLLANIPNEVAKFIFGYTGPWS